MDEIDAALDSKNVSIISAYLKERTKNAQFIVVSLRPNMYSFFSNFLFSIKFNFSVVFSLKFFLKRFESQKHLVGVFKTNDCSKSVTIKPDLLVSEEFNKEKPKEKAITRKEKSSVENNENLISSEIVN